MWLLSSNAILFTSVNLTCIFIVLLKDSRFLTVFNASDREGEVLLYK